MICCTVGIRFYGTLGLGFVCSRPGLCTLCGGPDYEADAHVLEDESLTILETGGRTHSLYSRWKKKSIYVLSSLITTT